MEKLSSYQKLKLKIAEREKELWEIKENLRIAFIYDDEEAQKEINAIINIQEFIFTQQHVIWHEGSSTNERKINKKVKWYKGEI